MTGAGNNERSGETIATRLRTAGLRVTPQRRAVLAAFAGATGGHLTAEEVGERARQEVPELARATVYKVLAELVRTGLLQLVAGAGAARYDSNPDREHQHFRCRRCGTLHDVDAVGMEGLHLRAGAGFVTERRTVVFEGLCPACGRLAGATTEGR